MAQLDRAVWKSWSAQRHGVSVAVQVVLLVRTCCLQSCYNLSNHPNLPMRRIIGVLAYSALRICQRGRIQTRIRVCECNCRHESQTQRNGDHRIMQAHSVSQVPDKGKEKKKKSKGTGTIVTREKGNWFPDTGIKPKNNSMLCILSVRTHAQVLLIYP